MNAQNKYKLYFYIGLLALGIAFGVGHFIKLPDFLDGFLKGIGIVWVIVGLFKFWKKREDQTVR